MNTSQQIQHLMDKAAALEWLAKQGGGGSHKSGCPTEDPESYAPCNCGAKDTRRVVNFLSELVLKS
jgi:hypothetical protein